MAKPKKCGYKLTNGRYEVDPNYTNGCGEWIIWNTDESKFYDYDFENKKILNTPHSHKKKQSESPTQESAATVSKHSSADGEPIFQEVVEKLIERYFVIYNSVLKQNLELSTEDIRQITTSIFIEINRRNK